MSYRQLSDTLLALWRRSVREPLLQFVVLGTLIFVVAHFAQSQRAAAQRQIVIDESLLHRIVQVNQAQSGVTPGPEQLKHLVEDYVDDEIMYREAVKMGLDQDDEIVRRRMIQKIQFLQRDLTATAKPGDNELRAYYGAHPELFTSLPTVAFEQLYFSADQGGWLQAQVRARHTLEQVRQLRPASALPLDDVFPLQIPTEELSRIDAGRLFGNTPIVEALFSAPEGQWSAPVRSAYGWHLIKVSHRQPPSVAAFAQVRAQVESAYLEQQTQTAQRGELAALRARYDIVHSGKARGG